MGDGVEHAEGADLCSWPSDTGWHVVEHQGQMLLLLSVSLPRRGREHSAHTWQSGHIMGWEEKESLSLFFTDHAGTLIHTTSSESGL